jgi:SAM-dependent methyltransferase
MGQHCLGKHPVKPSATDINITRRAASEIGAAAFLTPTRQDLPELLDQGIGSIADVRSNLKEMWRTNRYLGGTQALTYHLYPLLRQGTELTRIVDIGTGSGEMGSLLTRWATKNGLRLSVFALDISECNLQVARENASGGMHLVRADGCALPFVSNQVDYFISTLFLHHLSPERVIDFLIDTFSRARRGIVMSDLIRGYLPLLGFRFIQSIFARHYLTRHDGFLSIKRAYTPRELQALAQAAGLESARVYTHFPWRMTLVAEKPRV